MHTTYHTKILLTPAAMAFAMVFVSDRMEPIGLPGPSRQYSIVLHTLIHHTRKSLSIACPPAYKGICPFHAGKPNGRHRCLHFSPPKSKHKNVNRNDYGTLIPVVPIISCRNGERHFFFTVSFVFVSTTIIIIIVMVRHIVLPNGILWRYPQTPNHDCRQYRNIDAVSIDFGTRSGSL